MNLRRLLFWGVPTLLVGAGWIAQRVAYLRFLDHRPLTYGYFLTEAGKAARLWIVTVPTSSVAIALFAFWIAVTVVFLRRRAYLRVLWSFLWTAVAFVVFSLPATILDMQGSATIFI